VSVDMDKVGVMTAYCDRLCVSIECLHIQWTTHTHTDTHTHTHKHAQPVTICCHNTELVRVNRHDRTILVIFSQALYKAPWWWIFCDPKHGWNTFKYFFLILIVSSYYILCISWIMKCLVITDVRCKHEDSSVKSQVPPTSFCRVHLDNKFIYFFLYR